MELANIFPSKYVKATDLQGRETTVVIESAKIEKIGEDQKLVLYFQGKEKGLVTNRTNADRIAHLHGTNTDNWIGREITLFCDMVNYQGRVVDAIRVKAATRRPLTNGDRITSGPQHDIGPPMSNAPRASQRDQLDDEIPF